MTTETTEKSRRKKRELPINIVPLAVSHEVAAAMLAQISERSLAQLVADGKIRAIQITTGRVGYRYADLMRFIDEAPVIVPGQPATQGARKAP